VAFALTGAEFIGPALDPSNIDRRLRHLQVEINLYLADHNTDPKFFRWKASHDKIIAAAGRTAEGI
jgi:hypothetical protein